MDSQIFISIIIPVYNVEKYIKKCIESVLTQYEENFEIVVVDDESTDRTLEIAKQFEQENHNIRVFPISHGGQARARNFGIEQATGEYITFIDGDDYWEEGHLRKLCRILREETPDICVASQYYVVRGQNRTKETLFDVPYQGKSRGKEVIFQNINIPGSMCLLSCKKRFLEEHRIKFHEEYICNEDFDFFMQMIVHTDRVSTLSYPFYNYVRDNVTSTYNQPNGKKILVYMMVYRKWYDYYLNLNSTESYMGNILRGIENNYRWAVNMVRKLPQSDPERKKAMRFLAQTQYILWPDEKEKRFLGLYLAKRDITQRMKNWLLCMAGKVKRMIGC